MKNLAAVILAAGEGTRMKSAYPKALHKISGQPMLEYLLLITESFGIKNTFILVGHKQDRIKDYLGSRAKIIVQKRLLGTADALKNTKKALGAFKGDILILYTDTPLLSKNTVRRIISKHKTTKASCTILTANISNPKSYGRIIRGKQLKISRIAEDKDLKGKEKNISEINVGVYCFKGKDLFKALGKVKPLNKKKEYYLTDTIAILRNMNKKVESVSTKNISEIQGINSRFDLVRAEQIIRKRILDKHIMSGVTIVDPDNTYIDKNVTIGRDTIIYPYTIIEKNVKIGRDCRIGPFSRIRGCTILSNRAEVGNFVEVVRSKVGYGSKVKHHSYIGDTIIDKNVNVGAGTITANYDGCRKHITRIKDGAFIGSGTVLISPVVIGKNAVTGAGCVVTKGKNVPAGCVVAGVPAKILKKIN